MLFLNKIYNYCIFSSWLVPNFLTGFAEEDPLLQIVVDNTRNILYTRSEKGTVSVYDLGQNGEATEKVTSMSAQVQENCFLTQQKAC